MKRIQAACICQTLSFSQKPELGLSPEDANRLNRREADALIEHLRKNRIRYRIIEETQQENGTIVIRLRKQVSDRIDVEEYF